MPQLAVDFGVPARLFDKAVHHRQAQAGARAGGLGGEKGLKSLGRHLGRHAAAGVADRQQHVLAGADIAVLVGVGIVQRRIRHLDGQLARALHRVAGVDRQVEDRVLDLGRVHGGGPQPAGHDGLDLDGVANRAAHHVLKPQHQFADVDDLGRQRLPPPECQQLAGQLGAALDGLGGMGKPLFHLGLAGHVFADQVQVGRYHLQQVVEVMRHTASQLANGLHLLRLAQ